MFTTSRPPGRVMRASSAANAASSGDVLEHVHHHDAVELGAAERQPGAVHEVDVAGHQLADRRHRLLGEVGRGPRAAALAQHQADDAVVRAEVEAAQPARRARGFGRSPRPCAASGPSAEERARPAALLSATLAPRDHRRAERRGQRRAPAPRLRAPPRARACRRRDAAPWAAGTPAGARCARSRRQRTPRRSPRRETP